MNETDPKEKERLWTVPFILVLVVGVLSGAATQMVTPLIMKYAVALGAPLTIAATIASVLSIAALVVRPFSGMISDRLNRRTLLILSTAAAGLCVFAYSLVKNPGVMVAVRVIHGVAFAFMGVSNMAFASNYIPKSRMGEGIGWFGLSVIVAQAFGPGLGLELADNVSYSACFLCSAGFYAASVALMFLIPNRAVEGEEKSLARRSLRLDNFIEVKILLPAITLGMFSAINSLVGNYLSIIADERGIQNIGLFFTVYSIAVLIFRPFVSRLQDKRGLTIVLVPALLITALCMVLIGWGSVLWIMLLAAALKGLGQGTGGPSIQADCIKTLGKDRAGVATSTCYIGQDLGMIFGPILGSFAAEAWGYDGLFYSGAGALLLVGGGAYLLYILLRRRQAPAA